jgi:RNA-directed DNA polymerase
MNEAKPFCISKKEVWEAYKRVKENKGAAGVDEQTIEDFEKKLKKNLYKIWNRMSSGSYFPPPVRTVKIPKKNGGERKKAGHSYCGRSHCATGGQGKTGAGSRAAVPC